MISSFFRPKSGFGLILAFIVLLWFGAISLRATDRYVVPTNDTTHIAVSPYVNWPDAATNILDAVNVATNNDTVWVSNGVYVLTNQIVVTSNIVLRSANGPEVTIVNGNFTAGNPETNRCLYLSNSSAFVSGLTFSNGAYLANVANSGGGGVHIGAGIMSNCTVRNNTVFSPLSITVGGGGVLMGSGVCKVMECLITDNLVTNLLATSAYGRGAGIYAAGAAGSVVSGCIISNNRQTSGSSAFGGGVYAEIKITSSMICNNYNNDGPGGGVYLRYGSADMDSCTVTLNQAKSGDGVYMQAVNTISNCVISYNGGPYTRYGSGIYMIPDAGGCKCRVFNSTIIGNTCEGVRMHIGSAGSYNTMANCIIEGNLTNGVIMLDTIGVMNNSISNCVIRANMGGIDCTNGIIRNCLIANNTNNGSIGGLLIGRTCSTALVSGCTIVSNQSTAAGAGIRIEAANATLLISSSIIYSNGVSGTNDVFDACAPANIGALQYSCVGTNPGFTGAGIIVADPQFKEFSGGNYRLAANSPCINTGSNETWMTNAFDLDRRMRIRYGMVDMGAYERINEGTVYTVR